MEFFLFGGPALWGSWRCPIIGYHRPYLLQNRNPTHVHLWPSVRSLNIHQKCIKFADYYSSPTACQAPNLFLLRTFPITLNCLWSLDTDGFEGSDNIKFIFSVHIYVGVCMCVCASVGEPGDVLVFSSRLFEVNQCESGPFIEYVIYCNRIPDSIGVCGNTDRITSPFFLLAGNVCDKTKRCISSCFRRNSLLDSAPCWPKTQPPPRLL